MAQNFWELDFGSDLEMLSVGGHLHRLAGSVPVLARGTHPLPWGSCPRKGGKGEDDQIQPSWDPPPRSSPPGTPTPTPQIQPSWDPPPPQAYRGTTLGAQRLLERGDSSNLSGSTEAEKRTPLCLQTPSFPAGGRPQTLTAPESRPVRGGGAGPSGCAHSWSGVTNTNDPVVADSTYRRCPS